LGGAITFFNHLNLKNMINLKKKDQIKIITEWNRHSKQKKHHVAVKKDMKGIKPCYKNTRKAKLLREKSTKLDGINSNSQQTLCYKKTRMNK